jgi:hypothetical protein
MTEGVDYSFQVPSAAGLAAAGKHFAGRYVGPGFGKHLTVPERDALFAAGLDIFLNVEQWEGSAAGGYGVGQYHASLARDHAAQLGAPDHTALYFAIDFDVSSKGWPAVREYLRGAASVVGIERVGVYGGINAVTWAARDGVASWFFQTYAWSDWQWFGGNHVEQYRNHVELAGGNVDLCRAPVGNFGQWRADGADPGQIFPGDGGSTPTINQGDPNMILIVQKGSGATYTYNGVYRMYVGNPAAVAELVAAGVRQIVVEDVTQHGIEFDPREHYVDRDQERAANAEILAPDAPGDGGDGEGFTRDELVQIAKEGANAAEDS